MEANIAAIFEEASELGFDIKQPTPALFVLADVPYWQGYLEGAATAQGWPTELERLSSEVEDELGVSSHFLGIALQGEPPWRYDNGSPVLVGEPVIVQAW